MRSKKYVGIRRSEVCLRINEEQISEIIIIYFIVILLYRSTPNECLRWQQIASYWSAYANEAEEKFDE